MTMLGKIITMFFMASSIAFAAPAAAEEAPDALVQRISHEVFEAVKADEQIQHGDRQRILALVSREILPHVDFERMTALAVGRYWTNASLVQQQRLTEEFRNLLTYVYSGTISRLRDKRIRVNPPRGNPAGGEVEVSSEVVQARGAEPVELNYRLVREPDGWKIYDVSIMGIWLVQSYRPSFAAEIRNSGLNGLIRALAAKNELLAASGNAARFASGS